MIRFFKQLFKPKRFVPKATKGPVKNKYEKRVKQAIKIIYQID